jgi:hypothetical protein
MLGPGRVGVASRTLGSSTEDGTGGDAVTDEPDGTAAGRRRASAPAPCGGAVYGLGLIGAFVYFWQQADGLGEHTVGALKALVWPAFLVYEALRALQG